MTTTRRRTEANGAHVAALFLSIPFLLAFNGWVLKTAWNWFIPQITGWPRLGIAQAIGVAIVVGLARSRRTEDRDETPAHFWYGVALHIFSALLTLGIGWIVHEVMA
jgi:cytochrome bd-type quinol oxidase subunit 2